ncbi:hypothetical protein OSB04_010417 [Centaurea solstitialis]|uniref:Uncharacterized protein n=1 Tax=Centaurea solstitialis TaxID=347529 RepID=A0AA38TSC3_9ASTR|nr:hypothetical protein OSB04_010417 [Centaurea solstitialis]
MVMGMTYPHGGLNNRNNLFLLAPCLLQQNQTRIRIQANETHQGKQQLNTKNYKWSSDPTNQVPNKHNQQPNTETNLPIQRLRAVIQEKEGTDASQKKRGYQPGTAATTAPRKLGYLTTPERQPQQKV